MILPSVSVIVRAINEEWKLKKLLWHLQNQRYRGDMEVIVVDNESVDGTVAAAHQFGAKVVTIPREDFTFPLSLNKGAENARHEILIFTVAHALPIRNDWLASGTKHFRNPKVAGVYSPVLPHLLPGYPRMTIAELLFYSPGYLWARIRGAHPIRHGAMGVLGATNCALRRELWCQHHFDERFKLGGEDGEWAQWAMDRGYKIICDWRFAVYHSHGLNYKKLKEQFRYWSQLGKPTTFTRDALSFREDLDFST